MIIAGPEVVKWVLDKAGGNYDENMTAVGVEREGEIIAAVAYDGYTGENGSVFIHSRISSPHHCTRSFLFHIFAYPFLQLKVRRIFGIVDERKKDVIRFNRKVGFQVDGKLVEYFPDSSAILMSMGKDKCRWLEYSPGINK